MTKRENHRIMTKQKQVNIINKYPFFSENMSCVSTKIYCVKFKFLKALPVWLNIQYSSKHQSKRVKHLVNHLSIFSV